MTGPAEAMPAAEPSPSAGAAAPRVAVRSGGDPTDEEVAAIVAAVEVLWPRGDQAARPTGAPRWRFSGRWWSKPVPLRRTRPW